VNNKDKLLIFIKNSELGHVKTRLAKSIGDNKALMVYKLLLRKTMSETQPLAVEKIVHYSKKIEYNDIWDENIFKKELQEGESLGIRMKNAFNEQFKKNSQKVIIIGSDCYDISSKTIERGFKELEKEDVVIGPANDGGYYLLGMNHMIDSIFEEIDWSTDRVLKQTIKKLKKENKSFSLLEKLTDIDNKKDLKKCLPEFID